MIKLGYRADIDGLRAIAVLGVVIYHAFPQNLPGGFIGVDIFFVISGYLISGILYKGVRQGDFSFREFYSRRIRRLFPSLLTVLILCLLYGHFILLSDEYEQMGKHVASGVFFIQNLVFWQESGYFDVEANLKPLLHLWSLAVEEQFYIIFPPLLIVFWKRKWPMASFLWILLLTSFIGNLVMSVKSPAADFYLPTYRAWEFLLGSLLAWWHYGKNHEKEGPYADILSVAGTVLLILGMIIIQKGDPFPGWRALLPVSGTLMLIAAGRQALVNRWVFSHPWIVWVGLISYPLYLFHWPLLAFVHIIMGDRPADLYLAGALLIALILSVATYYLIEKPIRFSRSRYTVPSLVASFVIAGIFGLSVWKGVIPGIPITPEMEKIHKALVDKLSFGGPEWIQVKSPKGVGVFTIGGKGPQTLFYGDSFMHHYMPRVRELLKNNTGNTRGAISVIGGGTPPIPGLFRNDVPQCPDFIETFNKLIQNDPRIDRVVIAGNWPLYFNNHSHMYSTSGFWLSEINGKNRAYESFLKSLKELAQNKKVTLVLCVPVGDELNPRKYVTRRFIGCDLKESKNLSIEESRGRMADVNKKLEAIARENNVQTIDPLCFLSTNGVCLRENQDGPIRFDEGHLRPSYVREHVKYLDATVEP